METEWKTKKILKWSEKCTKKKFFSLYIVKKVSLRKKSSSFCCETNKREKKLSRLNLFIACHIICHKKALNLNWNYNNGKRTDEHTNKMVFCFENGENVKKVVYLFELSGIKFSLHDIFGLWTAFLFLAYFCV